VAGGKRRDVVTRYWIIAGLVGICLRFVGLISALNAGKAARA
jgi:hypothetical protein